MKRIILTICAVLITSVAFSSIIIAQNAITPAVAQQTQRVCFRVVDEAGEPLIGVSVQVKGTLRGAMTDIDGNVCIDVKPGDVLIISYIGYKPLEVKYEGTNFGTIQSIPSGEVLD